MTTPYPHPATAPCSCCHLYRAEPGGGQPGLDRIVAALTAARAGRGGTLFVTGGPGSGKTRLAAAAVAAAAAADMATAQGRSRTDGTAIPCRPLVEALLSLARAGLLPAPDDPYGTDADTPAEPRLVRTHDLLARLLAGRPAAEGGGTDPRAVADAVLGLLGGAAARQGCLLVLDDLHRADPSTLAGVEHLLDRIGSLPAVLLVTAGTEPGPATALLARARRRGAAAVLDLTPPGRPPGIRRPARPNRAARPGPGLLARQLAGTAALLATYLRPPARHGTPLRAPRCPAASAPARPDRPLPPALRPVAAAARKALLRALRAPARRTARAAPAAPTAGSPR
ncbi:ATP-binding protein [Streptomyces bambusae]|uniref:ATP-binding protein n=1 Tax=Streptomyces bambusae TaxID=1550616 RepID=UPI001CFED0B3|nr:ATP-binding protein [Streptomyces bambusae]MCB5164253.1 ATP-binding protein [Streptomyces bambusae]